MSIKIQTDNPDALLAAIRRGITEEEIATWIFDDDGDFTHTPDQWRDEAWFRPEVFAGLLRLSFLGKVGEVTTKEQYAVFHGRFIEMVLAHFDINCESCVASALPEGDDQLGSTS